MPKSLFFIIFLFASISGWGQATAALFPFKNGEYWGFMDASGRVVIPPKYRTAGDFSEGLAPVRIGGRYGYINAAGKLQIGARFDFAEPFLNGLGKVWLDGKPFFVQKNGRLTYGYQRFKIEGFEGGSERAIVTNSDDEDERRPRVGLMDRLGKFRIDTLFVSIEKWTDNRYICAYPYTDSVITARASNGAYSYDKDFPAICVLDSNGKVVIPTGRYAILKRADNQLASMEAIGDSAGSSFKYLNLSGEVVIFPPERRFSEGNYSFQWSERLTIGSLVSMPLDQWRQERFPMQAVHAGWFDLSGKFIEPDSISEFTTPFHDGRAFGRRMQQMQRLPNRYYLYNRQGTRIGDRCFQHFFPFWDSKQQMYFPFWEGVALIKNESGKIEVIDTMGNTLSRMEQYFYDNAKFESFDKFWKIKDPGGVTMIWDCEQKQFLENPMYETEILPSQGNFMIRGADFYGKLKYLDSTGKIIWEERRDTTKTEPAKLFADQLLDGVQFRLKANPVSPDLIQKDTLSFAIQPRGTPSFFTKYKTFPVYLMNTTADTFRYQNPVCFLQVLNEHQQWQDIIYHPVSFCGAGRDALHYLPPGECLEFAIPDLDGEIETQMRLCFVVNARWFVSTPFKSRINPGQLWRKPGYSRTGILKPYSGSERW